MRYNQLVENTDSQITQAIASLENKIRVIQIELAKVKQITKAVKYSDTVNDIIAKVTLSAEKVGIPQKSLDYKISEIFEAQSKLESAVYSLEEEFLDLIDQLESKVLDLESQISSSDDFPPAR